MSEEKEIKLDKEHDFVDDLDLTSEIDLDDIFGAEKRGVTDETLILSLDELGEMPQKKQDEEDLDKTVVLGFDEIPNPWRDEEDEVLDLFGKEGRTKIYPKDEDAASETTVLDRRALKDELSEEERAAEEIPEVLEEQAPEEPAEAVPEQEEKKRKHYKTHFFRCSRSGT